MSWLSIWPYRHHDLPVVVCDGKGAITAAYTLSKNGSCTSVQPQQLAKKKMAKCLLAIPPGSCIFRSMQFDANLAGSSSSKIEALGCYAQSSLLGTIDDYYTHVLSNDESATMLLCPKEILHNSISNGEQLGLQIIRIIIVELAEPVDKNRFLYYQNNLTNHLFLQRKNDTPLMNSVPRNTANLANLIASLGQQGNDGNPISELLHWSDKSENQDANLAITNDNLPPACRIKTINGWPGILAIILSGKNRAKLFKENPFKECLLLAEKKPASIKTVVKTCLALGITIFSAIAFFSSWFLLLESEVEILKKEEFMVHRAAKKASKATSLVREIQQQNNLLRTYAEHKPYVLELLKDITEATSGASKLESLNLTKDGEINIEGFSRDETHIASILKKLEESPLVENCRLVSINQLVENGSYGFIIEANSLEWYQFFQDQQEASL